MSKFVTLMNLTRKGVEEVEELPEKIDNGIRMFEEMGGKVLDVYLLMGDYDFLAVGETPDDETAAMFLLNLAKAGLVRTKTLKAFDREQMKEIFKAI